MSQIEKLSLMVNCIDDSFSRATHVINRTVQVYESNPTIIKDESINHIGLAAFFKIQYLGAIYCSFGVYPYTKYLELIPEDILNTLPKLLDSIEQFKSAINAAAPYLEKAVKTLEDTDDVEISTDKGVILSRLALATLESYITWQSLAESRENAIDRHMKHLSMGKAIDDAEYIKTVSDIHTSNERHGSFHLKYSETMSMYIKSIASVYDTADYDSFISNTGLTLHGVHSSYASVTYRNINSDITGEIHDGISKETIEALQEAYKI